MSTLTRASSAAQTRIDQARAELAQALREIEAALFEEKGRARGRLNQQRHELRRMLDPGYRYGAQAGQDVVVDRIFRGARDLRFADIGGYDGVTGSNTLFFEHHRGWTGLLVEPVAEHHARAALSRRCACHCVAVAPEEGMAEFLSVTRGFTQMSGLARSYDAALLAQVRANPAHAERVQSVRTRPLSALFEEAGFDRLDFVSLDIEGGELAVLEAFEFARHRVGVWAIENNTGGPDIGRVMRAAGYKLIEFCGVDEIWAHPDYTST